LQHILHLLNILLLVAAVQVEVLLSAQALQAVAVRVVLELQQD
jgi:hypothetical protein